MTEKSSVKRKAPISEFRALFEDGVTVKAIYEDLYCVDWLDDAQEVAAYLKAREFDIAGICKDGAPVCGYIRRQDLTGGICGEHALRFDETLLMSNSTPLIKALFLLNNQPYWFIIKDTEIDGIVTRADLQKPPVRILIFGIITLLEMNLTDLIRKLYGDSGWVGKLSQGRVDSANDLMRLRQARNEEIDLLECLQLGDKKELINCNEKALHILGFSSKTKAEDRLDEIKVIRDRVAHGQDLVSGTTWNKIVDAIKNAELLVSNCETFLVSENVYKKL